MIEVTLFILCAISICSGFFVVKLNNTISELREEIAKIPKHMPSPLPQAVYKPVPLVREKKTLSEEQKKIISEKAKARWAKKKALDSAQRPVNQALTAAS